MVSLLHIVSELPARALYHGRRHEYVAPSARPRELSLRASEAALPRRLWRLDQKDRQVVGKHVVPARVHRLRDVARFRGPQLGVAANLTPRFLRSPAAAGARRARAQRRVPARDGRREPRGLARGAARGPVVRLARVARVGLPARDAQLRRHLRRRRPRRRHVQEPAARADAREARGRRRRGRVALRRVARGGRARAPRHARARLHHDPSRRRSTTPRPRARTGGSTT